MLVSKGKIIALDKVNVDSSLSGDGRWGTSNIGLSQSTWDNINSRVLSSDFLEYSGKMDEEIQKLYGIGSFSGPYTSTATIPEEEAKNTKTIYLIEAQITGKDVYEEYFYSDTKSAYVCFGEASLDLSVKLDKSVFESFKNEEYDEFTKTYDTYTANTDKHLLSLDNNKFDVSAFDEYYTDFKVYSADVDLNINKLYTDKLDVSSFNEFNTDFETFSSNITQSANDLYDTKLDKSVFNTFSGDYSTFSSNIVESAEDLYDTKLDKSQFVVTALDFVDNKTLYVSGIEDDVSTYSSYDLVDVSAKYTEGDEIAKINGNSIYVPNEKTSIHIKAEESHFEERHIFEENGITIIPYIDTLYNRTGKYISISHPSSGKYLITYNIVFNVPQTDDLADKFCNVSQILSTTQGLDYAYIDNIIGFLQTNNQLYTINHTQIYEPQISEDDVENGALIIIDASEYSQSESAVVSIDWITFESITIDIVKIE